MLISKPTLHFHQDRTLKISLRFRLETGYIKDRVVLSPKTFQLKAIATVWSRRGGRGKDRREPSQCFMSIRMIQHMKCFALHVGANQELSH